jgi:hypothetical protein
MNNNKQKYLILILNFDINFCTMVLNALGPKDSKIEF